MSLLNIDLRKIKLFSLKGVKLPVKEIIKYDPLYTNVVVDEQPRIDILKLRALAQNILEEKNNYTKEEIITILISEQNIDMERAELSFNLFLQVKVIESTCFDRYYLTDSTPF
jgi:hypothetical protein